MADVDLQRFIDAQRDTFDHALGEIEEGRKTTHWMWFVFPQVAGLGLSPTSVRYAIRSVAEAKAFMDHPILGERYRRVVDAVWTQVVERGVTVHDLFGSPDDAKLVSSLTLFGGIAGKSNLGIQAGQILEAAYTQGLRRCTTTEQFLPTRV